MYMHVFAVHACVIPEYSGTPDIPAIAFVDQLQISSDWIFVSFIIKVNFAAVCKCVTTYHIPMEHQHIFEYVV